MVVYALPLKKVLKIVFSRFSHNANVVTEAPRIAKRVHLFLNRTFQFSPEIFGVGKLAWRRLPQGAAGVSFGRFSFDVLSSAIFLFLVL